MSKSDNQWNLYQQIQDAVIAEIHKYAADLVVTDEYVTGQPPPYPYVSIDIYDDYTRASFADVDNEAFYVSMDLKAVSDNKNEAKAIGMWLRKLLFLRVPHTDLLKQHIVAVSCDAIPDTNAFLDVTWQFMAGADYKLMVQDDFTDDTQPGFIQDLHPRFTAKGLNDSDTN